MSWIAARRYAKALMDIGVDRGAYHKYAAELAEIQATIHKTPFLKATLLNRSFSNRSKGDFMRLVFTEKSFSGVVINFVSLLVKRDRIQHLPFVLPTPPLPLVTATMRRRGRLAGGACAVRAAAEGRVAAPFRPRFVPVREIARGSPASWQQRKATSAGCRRTKTGLRRSWPLQISALRISNRN